MMPESAKKSCRMSFGFDKVARDESAACRENSTVQLGKEIGVVVEETHVGLAHDLNTSMKQALNSYMSSFPEDTQAQRTCFSESNPLSNVGFAELLALADAAWAHSNALHPGNNDGLRKPSILSLKSQFLGDPVTNPTNTLLSHHHLSLEQRYIIHDNSQESQGTSNIAFCSKRTSQVTPPTPDNAIRAESRQVAARQINIGERDPGGEEKNVPAKKLDSNGTPHKKNVTEGKPKRTQKPVTPKPVQSKENPTGKRKYVRRKGLNKTSTPPTEVTGELTKPIVPEPAKMSCRRSLSIDIGTRDESSACRENSTVHLGKKIGVVVEETHVDLAYDKNTSMKQKLNNYMSLPEDTQAPGGSLSEGNPPGAKPNANFVENNKRKGQATAQDGHENSAKILLKSVAQSNPNNYNSSNSQISTIGLQMVGSKRKRSGTIKRADTSNVNLIGAHYNGLPAYQTKCWVQFPKIQKKRKSEKGKTYNTSSTSSVTTTNHVQLATCPLEDAQAHPYASSSSCWIFGSEYNAARVPAVSEATESAIHDEPQTFKYNLSLSQTRLTKRSRAPTQIFDSASLTRIRNGETKRNRNHTAKQLGISDRQTFGDAKRPGTCIDALVAEIRASLTKRRRTKKKRALFRSAYSSTTEMQQHRNFAFGNNHLPSGKSLDIAREVIWKHMHTVNALAEQFRQLNINKEARDLAFPEQNALVPYKQENQKQNSLAHGDCTIIPIQGSFDPIRKQHLRPKVDLDEETVRVWKLLMLDINIHGIDGKDKDKAKWWEEKRNVFHGRADSFIAWMHLVQGDRRISQWKGSVVDSVIGVLLTQNVSNQLSSSAFLSLAARFPQKSSSKCKTYLGKGTHLVVNKPQVRIVELEENTEWDEEILNQSVYDQSSITMDIVEHSEEKEAVNSCRTTSSVISLTDESNCRQSESAQRNIREHHSPMKSGPISAMTEDGQEKSCYGGVRNELNDVVSSPCSVISSQISGYFSTDQNPEKIGSCPDSNSEVEDLSSTAKYNIFNSSTSFSKLLEMARSTKLHQVNCERSKSTENLRDAFGQSICMEHDNPTENLEKSNVIQGSLEASSISSQECTLKLNPNSGVLEIHCFDPFKTEASSSGFLKDKEDKKRESASHVAVTHSHSIGSQLHPQEQSNHMKQNLFNISGQTQDLMQKASELDVGDQGPSPCPSPAQGQVVEDTFIEEDPRPPSSPIHDVIAPVAMLLAGDSSGGGAAAACTSTPSVDELDQLVTPGYLRADHTSLLNPFFERQPQMRLADVPSPRVKGFAYTCLANLLLFLRSHSTFDALASGHAEFMDLLQDVRSFSFDTKWLRFVEEHLVPQTLSAEGCRDPHVIRQNTNRELDALSAEIDQFTRHLAQLHERRSYLKTLLEDLSLREGMVQSALNVVLDF